MAEYVRRKRPPASHPYWARLHDRTHPPSCKWALFWFGFFGLITGGGCGGSGAITMYDAFWYSSRYALIPTILLTTIYATLRYQTTANRPAAQSIISTGTFSVMTFMLTYLFSCFAIGIFSIAFWYPLSGIGAFRGCLGGMVYGAVLGYFITWPQRRHWWYRQANWPRWEEMTRLHRRNRQVPPINPPVAPPIIGQERQFGN